MDTYRAWQVFVLCCRVAALVILAVILWGCSPEQAQAPDTAPVLPPGQNVPMGPPDPVTPTLPPTSTAAEPAPAPPAPEPVAPVVSIQKPTRLISTESRDLLIAFEVSSPERYTRLYSRPICPLCETTASGVTIGIGFDLRHNAASVIRQIWHMHSDVERLAAATGIGGREAIALAREMNDIIVPYEMAEVVFDEISVLMYYRICHRAFGDEFLVASAHIRGVLVSTCYNRGGSMTGGRRVEMRAIKNECLIPNAHDYECVARQLELMATRLFANIPGLRDRYFRTAKFVRSTL